MCCVEDFWVGSDLIFINNFWISNNSCGLVISTPYVFPSESVSLLNCGVCSESIFAAKLWSQQRINSRCWIMVSAMNQFSLPNYGGSSELIFTAEFVESTTNQFLLLKYGVSSEPVFATEFCVSSELVFATEFGVTSEPVSPTILYSSKSVPWQTCITNEPDSLQSSTADYISELVQWLKWLHCMIVIYKR